MTTTVIELGNSRGEYRPIRAIRFEIADDYEPSKDEIVVDGTETINFREAAKPHRCVDLSGPTPTVVTDPDYTPPDPLDRAAIDPALIDTYREARGVYLAERENFIDAKQADDVQGQLDALASLAENATVPALDALFQVAMGEEP